MLPKKERLNRAEFSKFFAVGKRMHFTGFMLIVAPYPTFHASVVVSKKVLNTAVARNKLRRRIYDIVRNYHKQHACAGVYIFITKKEVTSLKFPVLREIVHESLQSAKKHIT